MKRGDTSGRPLDVALGDRAARMLGSHDTDRWRERVTEARTTMSRVLQAGAGSSGDAYALGLLLESEGRRDEAREAFTLALRLPDRHLSHHLAREGLARVGPD